MKKVIVIGAGFSGLAAATGLADKGYDVTILEKIAWRVVVREFLRQRVLHLIWTKLVLDARYF
jgi:2-polyprenyl-6-methoxyphenol hydroxylase-like FAD-dependent oxidoreductase